MNLSEFISSSKTFYARAIAFFDKAEAQAASPTALANTSAITELQGKIDAAAVSIAAKDATILELQGKITKLEADAVSAGEQAAKIVSAQGIPPVTAPKDDKGSANANGGNLVTQLAAITDPAEKVTFINQNYAALYKLRK